MLCSGDSHLYTWLTPLNQQIPKQVFWLSSHGQYNAACLLKMLLLWKAMLHIVQLNCMAVLWVSRRFFMWYCLVLNDTEQSTQEYGLLLLWVSQWLLSAAIYSRSHNLNLCIVIIFGISHVWPGSRHTTHAKIEANVIPK